jgi:6-pyruvoyltetrahydropterin/6-carboxytetrahydropterin synthase
MTTPNPQSSIFIKHNAEVAHRLSQLPGKCQKIHGHSMQITLRLDGELDDEGILCGLDYGTLKKVFRNYIDSEYDHRLLLNANDPWAALLMRVDTDRPQQLPGLKTTPGDPTTENVAKWICQWVVSEFAGYGPTAVHVTITETGTNGAMAKWSA